MLQPTYQLSRRAPAGIPLRHARPALPWCSEWTACFRFKPQLAHHVRWDSLRIPVTEKRGRKKTTRMISGAWAVLGARSGVLAIAAVRL